MPATEPASAFAAKDSLVSAGARHPLVAIALVSAGVAERAKQSALPAAASARGRGFPQQSGRVEGGRGPAWRSRPQAHNLTHRMQVRETTLKELIQGEKQFRVPLWQRQYTSKQDNLKLLWSDILEQYDQLSSEATASSSSGHFLGSFVLSPAAFAASDVATFLIVDGQQRMTTLLLLLCALRDAQAVDQPGASARINDLYLINTYKEGLSRLRLLPTQQDREAFELCVKADSTLR